MDKNILFGFCLLFSFFVLPSTVMAESKKHGLVDYGRELKNASMVHTVPALFDLQRDNPNFVIVHAEILSLSVPYTTPAKPATGRIRIHKVLRGRNEIVPRDTNATFSAPYLDGIKETQHFAMPTVGSHVMISYCCLDLPKYRDENTVSTQNEFVLWTPENESKVLSTMVAPLPKSAQPYGTAK